MHRTMYFGGLFRSVSSFPLAQVDAAEGLTGSGGDRKREGVEPRSASLENDENVGDGGGGGANEAGLSLHPHQHPSSTVARDSLARVAGLGQHAAASLVQSRFRGYRARRKGGTEGSISGVHGRADGPIAGEAAINAWEGGWERHGRSGGGEGANSEKCSILDLEVRNSALAYQGQCRGG